jgi:hypothetical protein
MPISILLIEYYFIGSKVPVIGKYCSMIFQLSRIIPLSSIGVGKAAGAANYRAKEK